MDTVCHSFSYNINIILPKYSGEVLIGLHWQVESSLLYACVGFLAVTLGQPWIRPSANQAPEGATYIEVILIKQLGHNILYSEEVKQQCQLKCENQYNETS